MLFYTTGAVVPLLINPHDPSEAPATNIIDLTIKGILYAVTIALALRHMRNCSRAARTIPWILLPVLMTVVSVVWSQNPSRSLTGSTSLLSTTLFGVYFGTRYSIWAQLRLLVWTFILAIAISYYFALCLPQYGIDHSANYGQWQGAFVEKNNLAEVMVLGCCVFCSARQTIKPVIRWLALAASAGLIFLAGSATGFVVAMCLAMMLPLYALCRVRFSLVIPACLMLVVGMGTGIAYVRAHTSDVFRIVNRSPDLTGRTDIWLAVLHSISKRPLLGYGYNAFWLGTSGESGSVMDAAGWTVGYAHNGYLDVAVQLGFVGLAIWGIGYLNLWRQSLILISGVGGSIPIWLSTFLAFILLYNITEGDILTQNSIYWVLYISTAINLSKLLAAPQLSLRGQ